MNLALALGGGAARGAFHLGVLHFCEENNIEIVAYSGSSIGSIIACSQLIYFLKNMQIHY